MQDRRDPSVEDGVIRIALLNEKLVGEGNRSARIPFGEKAANDRKRISEMQAVPGIGNGFERVARRRQQGRRIF